jgi:hypothetical protein
MTAIQLKAAINAIGIVTTYEMIKMNGLPMTESFKKEVLAKVRGLNLPKNNTLTIEEKLTAAFGQGSYNQLGHLYINSIKTDAKVLAKLEWAMAGMGK